MNNRPPDPSPPVPVLPFAGPRHDHAEPIAWANGPFLVMRKDARLPDRCVRCNRPADGIVMTKRLFWMDDTSQTARGVTLFLPLVRIGYAFGNLARWLGDLRTFQLPKVTVGVCRRHRNRFRFLTMIAWCALPIGIILATRTTSEYARLWLPVAGLAITVFTARVPRPVKPVHVGVHHVTLEGAGPEYLIALTPPAKTEQATAATTQDILSSTSELRNRMRQKRAGPPT